MPIQWTSNPQRCYPDGADGIALTPSGTAWTWPATFTTIEASTFLAAVLSGVILRTAENNNQQIEVQIAVGAPGAETVIATVKTTQRGHAFTSDFVNVRWVFPIPVDAIAAGARVSGRVRVSTTITTAYQVSLQYYAKPLVGNLQVSAKPINVLPFGAAAALLNTTAGWGAGTNVQLTAATAAAWVIEGASIHVGSNDEGEVEVVTGPDPGTVVARFRADAGNVGGWDPTPCLTPFDVIPAGVRVSARARTKSGSQTDFSLSYREKPL